jgi:hypothetical protein
VGTHASGDTFREFADIGSFQVKVRIDAKIVKLFATADGIAPCSAPLFL